MMHLKKSRNAIAAATLVAMAAVAASTAAAQAQSIAAPEPSPRITVSAVGTADAAPDMAVITLTVLRQGETAREALDENNSAMATVLAAMKAQGIAERDLQTSNFNIQPRYARKRSSNGNGDAPVIEGYDVSNTLTVRIRNLASLGSVLDQSVTLGVNQGGGVRFTNSDPDPIVEEARKNAMRAAIRKAEVLTETAGVALGPVVEISEQSFQSRPVPMARAEMALASAPAVPIAAGESTYSVTVTVTYALDQ